MGWHNVYACHVRGHRDCPACQKAVAEGEIAKKCACCNRDEREELARQSKQIAQMAGNWLAAQGFDARDGRPVVRVQQLPRATVSAMSNVHPTLRRNGEVVKVAPVLQAPPSGEDVVAWSKRMVEELMGQMLGKK